MKTLEELCAMRDELRGTMGIRHIDTGNTRVTVSMGTCGIAAGARAVLLAFADGVDAQGLGHVTVSQTGCVGLCSYEPVAVVTEPNGNKTTYIKLTPEKAAEIVKLHLAGGSAVAAYAVETAN